MPAVGVPVTLRMLSAPEPREHRPRSWMVFDHVDGIGRPDFADLNVGARGDMRIAAAIAFMRLASPCKAGPLQYAAVRQSAADTMLGNSGSARRRTDRSSASGNLSGGLGYSAFLRHAPSGCSYVSNGCSSRLNFSGSDSLPPAAMTRSCALRAGARPHRLGRASAPASPAGTTSPSPSWRFARRQQSLQRVLGIPFGNPTAHCLSFHRRKCV